MIIIENGEVTFTDDRYKETCRHCGAMGYGNATCRHCVAEWPRFGVSQQTTDRLLAAIGDQPPVPPVGTIIQ